MRGWYGGSRMRSVSVSFSIGDVKKLIFRLRCSTAEYPILNYSLGLMGDHGSRPMICGLVRDNCDVRKLLLAVCWDIKKRRNNSVTLLQIQRSWNRQPFVNLCGSSDTEGIEFCYELKIPPSSAVNFFGSSDDCGIEFCLFPKKFSQSKMWAMLPYYSCKKGNEFKRFMN